GQRELVLDVTGRARIPYDQAHPAALVAHGPVGLGLPVVEGRRPRGQGVELDGLGEGLVPGLDGPGLIREIQDRGRDLLRECRLPRLLSSGSFYRPGLWCHGMREWSANVRAKRWHGCEYKP